MGKSQQEIDLLREINRTTGRILKALERPPKTTFLSVAGQAGVFAGITGGLVALADFLIRLIGGKL